eukprot:Gregarina_sp_Poly_1__1445@NODE_1360_length_4299_cov_142_056002_g303_i2_p1_GENE_NODE_1360_length_4299_cov_142_056002_g303_i2NODE_1360_length_4299_cov_142_056002_g303_i2_p1_ORF_typecomplete_len629_score70_75Exostosin/PF03016_15/1_9e34_NODE_1360_length_4299_cov_142_056002_g303_i223954281
MLAGTQSASPRMAAQAVSRWWETLLFKISGLKKSQKLLKTASYFLPLLICSLSLMCLIGVLRVYDPVSTKNLKHQSNLSTFMGLVSGPRPFTHLGSLLQQLRLGLREPRGDIVTYKDQLRTEIFYLKKELALLERDLKAGDTQFYPRVWSSEGIEKDAAFNTRDIANNQASYSAMPVSWLDRENVPVNSEFSEIAIPFYMYELEEFLEFERQCLYTTEGHLGEGGHMGEYYFHQSLKKHRWRVRDPAQAVLFVVPVYLGAALDGMCGGEDAGKSLILEATKILSGQSWFQRYSGNDHIFVATHWRVFWWFRDVPGDKTLEVWNKLIWGRFMAAFEESFCPLVTPYSTLPAFDKFHERELVASRSASLERYMETRNLTFFFMGRVFFEHHQGGYATRRAMFEQIQNFRGPNAIITTLAPDQLEIPTCQLNEQELLSKCTTEHSDKVYTDLAMRSRFHLMIRGDDWSSSRLFDAIYSGALIVVVSDGLLDKALPFGCEVDWDGLLIRIPEKEFRRNATFAIERHVPDWNTAEGRADLQRRLRILHNVIDDVIWTSPNTRVAENILYNAARRCLPEALLLRRETDFAKLGVSRPVASLSELTCAFTDFAKGVYKPGRHGVGAFQEGWNQDD